jgi:hypothetical protein
MSDTNPEIPTISHDAPSPSFLQKVKSYAIWGTLAAWILTGLVAAALVYWQGGVSGTAKEMAMGLALPFLMGPLHFAKDAVMRRFMGGGGAGSAAGTAATAAAVVNVAQAVMSQ